MGSSGTVPGRIRPGTVPDLTGFVQERFLAAVFQPEVFVEMSPGDGDKSAVLVFSAQGVPYLSCQASSDVSDKHPCRQS